jgi:transposase
MKKHRTYSAEFKARVALEALNGALTLAELSTKHGVHPNMIAQWKRTAQENLPALFARGADRSQKERDEEVKELHAKVGQLTMERDFLAKAFSR